MLESSFDGGQVANPVANLTQRGVATLQELISICFYYINICINIYMAMWPCLITLMSYVNTSRHALNVSTRCRV